MAQSSKQKQRFGAKPTVAKKNQITTALAALRDHVLPIAEQWSKLTPDQRQLLLEHSPLLADFVRLAAPFYEKN